MNVIYHDQQIETYARRLFWSSVGLSALLGLSVTANVFFAVKPTPPPVVVAVNPAGDPVGILQPLAGNSAIADATIRYALGQWIENAFTMEANWGLENDRLRRVYAMLPDKSQAYQALTGFYNSDKAHNPGTASEREWQSVKLTRTLKLPRENAYEVDFTLERHRNNDEERSTTNWRAVMAVQQSAANANNLLGLYITSIDFGAEQQ